MVRDLEVGVSVLVRKDAGSAAGPVRTPEWYCTGG
jgi:hypothetical protein